MSAETIYAMSWQSNFGQSVPVLLCGPKMSEKAFDELCRELMEDAGRLALRRAKRKKAPLGTGDILEGLISLLRKREFALLPCRCWTLYGAAAFVFRDDADDPSSGPDALQQLVGVALGREIVAHNEEWVKSAYGQDIGELEEE